jgi:hypothetical protein
MQQQNLADSKKKWVKFLKKKHSEHRHVNMLKIFVLIQKLSSLKQSNFASDFMQKFKTEESKSPDISPRSKKAMESARKSQLSYKKDSFSFDPES